MSTNYMCIIVSFAIFLSDLTEFLSKIMQLGKKIYE